MSQTFGTPSPSDTQSQDTQSLDKEALEKEALELMRQKVQEIEQLKEVKPTTVSEDVAEKPKEPKAGTKITASDVSDAEGVLAMIDGGENILVVPDDAMLGTVSQDNPAITIKDQSKIGYFQRMLETFHEGGRYETSLYSMLLRRVAMDTIVVKHEVVRADDIKKCGTIWHEHGHVKYGAAESGQVFVYELKCLRAKRGDGETKAFITEHREGGGYYEKFAVGPGLEELTQQLTELGFAFKPGRAAVEAAVRAQRKRPGAKVRGDRAALKRQLKASDDAPAEIVSGDIGCEFDWADYKFRLDRREFLFTIEVVDGKSRGRTAGSKVTGAAFQLKSKAEARDDAPNNLQALQPGASFEWDGSSWKLVTAEPSVDLVVVADLATD